MQQNIGVLIKCSVLSVLAQKHESMKRNLR